ncbi:MAG: DEAD/DEAH box helicase [Ottowia sp.]|nr:DEAD/DEAH box helicase [Ottowia sp.]
MNTDTPIDTTAKEALAASPVGENFADFGLDAQILRAIADQGYSQATPIQTRAIPVVLQGCDVMGAAQTGTGKTAAFVLPIIQRLLAQANESASPARHPVRALILAPTRELANQVADNAHRYARYTSLRTAVVFGGIDMTPQIAQLRNGVELLIATPGRLLDHVQQKSVNLSQIELLVLDEADRMLDMGFLPDLQRIINLLPTTRQTLLFSATFSPEIKKLANSYLRHPVTIEVAGQNATAENVNQIFYTVPEADRRAAIIHILQTRASRQCIIFCNSKLACARLSRALVLDGIKAGALHGDKSQGERMQMLAAFKSGEVEVLVATDVAARGLDISDMPCVINFDLPYNAEDYVHRIGRTGRAGASGDAISLFSVGDEKALAAIEALIKRRLHPVPLAGWVPQAHTSDTYKDRGRRTPSLERSTPSSDAPWNRPLPTQKALDPFFSQPYVPSITSATDTPAQTENKSSADRNKRPLAALLGGLRRKT